MRSNSLPEIFSRSDAFLRQQEWAEKALSYSLANLTEGEPAGLLAFGQSYANNGTFTAWCWRWRTV